MDRVLVIDLGSTKLKLLEFIGGTPAKYHEYNLDGENGVLDPKLIKMVVEENIGKYDAYIVTGQRASIIGWTDDGEPSKIYTWRSSIDETLREKYFDPEDFMMRIFLRPGSGALRIKYLQDEGYRFVGGIESYVVWLLSELYIVDYAYAHPYGIFDPFQFKYVDYLIEKLEIDPKRLPKIVDSFKDCYERGEAPIIMIPDQSAALVAEGLDVAKATLGTGAFIDIYTAGDLLGDPERGVNPMLALYIDGSPFYMAEAFIFDWGVSLDRYLAIHGLDYSSIGDVDLTKKVYKVYPPVLRSTLSPKPRPFTGDYSLRDVVLTLVGSLGHYIEVLREVSDFASIYLNGGGARLDVIAKLLAEAVDIDVLVREYPEKASLYGAYLYFRMRLGDGFRVLAERYRPVKNRYRGSGKEYWIVEHYREAMGSSQ